MPVARNIWSSAAVLGVVSKLRRLARNSSGNIGIIAALVMPILVGAAGLGVEAGFWQYRQRTLQHLADVASYSGAVELLQSGRRSRAREVALEAVADGDFREEIGAAQVQSPPASGAFVNADAVSVALQETWPRYLSALFLSSDVTVHASAVSEVELGEVCVLALHPTAASALSFAGGANTTSECGLASNSSNASSISVAGSAHVEATCASAVGGISGALTLTECGGPRAFSSPTIDPFAQLAEPAVSGNCKMPNNFGGPSGAVHTVVPGRYCGMTVSRTANLAPGVYVIDGGQLRFTSTARVNGTGVTFILRGGATVDFQGGATLNLSAPSDGPYKGVLMFGRRTGSTSTHSVRGGASTLLNGALYFPNDAVVFSGNGDIATECTQIVARTIEFTGRSRLNISNCPIRIGRMVRLVQ